MPHMSETEMTYRPSKPLSNTTLTVNVLVKPTFQYHARLWLGTRLIVLAALVLGCAVEIGAQVDKRG